MTTYQQETWRWKLQKLIQQSSEWWEFQLRKLFKHSPKIPELVTPDLSFLEQLIRGILLLLAIGLIAWGVLRIIKLANSYYQSSPRRLETNPFPKDSQIPTQEWLKRSQKFQQDKDYYQACRCLYFAMLHHLHEKGYIPLEKGRTDQEYCYLILCQLPYPSPYETLLNIHEKLSFSSEKATLEHFEECQQAYQEISVSTPS